MDISRFLEISKIGGAVILPPHSRAHYIIAEAKNQEKRG